MLSSQRHQEKTGGTLRTSLAGLVTLGTVGREKRKRPSGFTEGGAGSAGRQASAVVKVFLGISAF